MAPKKGKTKAAKGVAGSIVASERPLLPVKLAVYEDVSHRECVFVDQIGPDEYKLTNVVSKCSVALPQGHWTLAIDEESGVGALYGEPVDSAIDDVALVGDMLPITLIRDTDSG